jgi:hypothetical protein
LTCSTVVTSVVCRKHPRAHWQPVARDRQPDDDLRHVVATVLRVPVPPQRRIAPPPRQHVAALSALVFLVDLEVQRRRVVEDQVHVGIH